MKNVFMWKLHKVMTLLSVSKTKASTNVKNRPNGFKLTSF